MKYPAMCNCGAREWIVASLLIAAASIAAGDVTVDRFTIDAGGGTSAGGTFEFSATIGQPDAGRMFGNAYTLTGGFWGETPRGDCNADGLVNLLDLADFVPCLDGPDFTWSDPACRCFDFDADDDVDLRDFAMFSQAFVS